jgi:multifunctional 2-oxoglutarate metabolism enzyme
MINPNTAYENELYFKYLKDPNSVSPEWRKYFVNYIAVSSLSFAEDEISEVDINVKPAPTKTSMTSEVLKTSDVFLNQGESLELLSSISSKISQNMEESLEIPSATSTRTMPVKALDENRRIINKHLSNLNKPRVSFTHILSWAIIRAIVKFPKMNDSFLKSEGKAYRLKKNSINFGLAVDIVKKDGSRLLLVPNVKDVQNMTFVKFVDSFDRIIEKTRQGKYELSDLEKTTVTLTNPGMIGTTMSAPRLMKGQGIIIAAGSIDYPTEFQAVRPEVLTNIAISKVVTLTNTYDHRIIQGAESAEFLAYINKLLLGAERFYDHIFASLAIPFEPIRWQSDVVHSRFAAHPEDEITEKAAHVMLLINAYRVRGHLLSSINPLGHISYYYPELDPAYYGFNIWDLERVFHADDAWENNNLPLRDIIELLRDTYCGSTGYEFMHIQDTQKKEWVKTYIEKKNSINHTLKGVVDISKEDKLNILKKIYEAQEFESFLHTKFIGHKRFSLEGSESLVVMINKLFELAADAKLNTIVLGMAHRGRLNILVNLMGKSLDKIFNEFDGEIDPVSYFGSGDVKYHLGDKSTFISKNNNSIEVILSPNPSHLELVNPVVEGMARALDDQLKDNSYSMAIPILIHGDSAFAGEGVVAETLNLSELKGYRTGGTIHIIINNQIGFTTTPQDERSTVYASDLAKMIQAPIIHVNGNDPEAVFASAVLAFTFRQTFHNDIVIDMLCYRKYGHNEADEPSYTQPLLYKKIAAIPPVSKIYEEKLKKEGLYDNNEILNYIKELKQHFNDVFDNRRKKEVKPKIEKNETNNLLVDNKTSIDEDSLKLLATKLSELSDNLNFNINPKVKSFINRRQQMIISEKPAIDWSFAEALSIGSILLEGITVRMSGEDTRRGTFSQRHAVLIDVENEDEYIPLNNLSSNQGEFKIYDSPLSELAVLGYEYGYSIIAKDGLTIWEAQFGDFANMAQPILDQFLSCGESKWGQASNLVMLVPHSYDGQGPEHSSSRFERYLQLCAENNMFVCNLTSPAQYFHALRRQVKMKDKKPLIIPTPKGMLRHPLAVSSIKEFTETGFQEIIDHPTEIDKNQVSRLILCTGKIYYDLFEEQLKTNPSNIAIIRIEQLYPLHEQKLSRILNQYLNTNYIIWAQEEPENMGAWRFLQPQLLNLLKKEQGLTYIGRPASAATATGSLKVHQIEQRRIIESALNII